MSTSSLAPYSDLHDALQGYKVQKRLGSGGFGQVLKAKNLATGKSLAIKIISCIDENITLLK